MKVTFAVTAYEETKKKNPTIDRCLENALAYDNVSEIIVVDDASSDFEQLQDNIGHHSKVKLYTNSENLGVFVNKIEAVARATNHWVICCDSDNTMDCVYIDTVLASIKNLNHWYCPSFAKPKFDYRSFIGQYRREDIYKVIEAGGLAGCLLNTGNQVVNRSTFMNVFGAYRQTRADLLLPNWLELGEKERKEKEWRIVFDACDSLIFNYLWLNTGGTMNVTAGLEYDHYWTGGDESHYNRAPKAKHKLNDILMSELLRQSKECSSA